MSAIIPRRTFLALARSRPHSTFCTSLRPSQLHLPSLGLLRDQRHFSASTCLQVQYTRFPNGYTYHSRQNRARNILLVLATSMGTVYYVAHLERMPETGRWRFMDVSPTDEAVLQKTSYEMLLSEFHGKILPPHHPTTRHVHRVVSGLLEASDLGSLHSTNLHQLPVDDGFWSDAPFATPPTHDLVPTDGGTREWNLLVVNDPSIVNALASFGTIVVFTGILPVCRNEQGLAAVVSHEIGHAVARHASERQSAFKIFIYIATLLQAVGVEFGVTRLLNYLLFNLPNSRMQELEADTLGMRIAAKACYDPRSAVDMHMRLAGATEAGLLGSIPELLRTHPLPQRRIKHLEELVPEGQEIRAANPRCAGVHDSVAQFIEGVTRWG